MAARSHNCRLTVLLETASLPNIGRATATMCLGIADATLAAAADEITCGYVRQGDGRQRRCHTGHHHVGESRLGLKGSSSLATGPSERRESDERYQEADAAHWKLPQNEMNRLNAIAMRERLP